MIKQNKRGQFFVISLVLIALMFLIVFSYFRSSEEAGIVLFQPGSELDLQNIANAIESKNKWLNDASWYNASWKYRKPVSITSITSNPVEINLSLASTDKHLSDCDNEIRVWNSSGIVPSNVTSNSPPCNVVFYAATGSYYIYYGNPTAPDANNASSGTPPGYTVGSEETSRVCDHLKYIYQTAGKSINCSVANLVDAQTVNYSIKFYSTDLKFEGFLY